jgi:hypothetical protein
MAIESEKRTNLKSAGCDVERMRNFGPFAKIVAHLPVGIAVINDEQIAAAACRIRFLCFFFGNRHSSN